MWFTAITTALGFIPQLLGFGTNLTNKITELEGKKIAAKTQEEKDKLDAEIGHLKVIQAQQAVEAKYNAKSTQLLRASVVVSVAVYVFTCMVWDKVVCKAFSDAVRKSSVCTTDPLDANLWWIVMSVICFLFLTAPPKRG